MKKIILVGYMGSGKSTVGSLIAKELDIPFIDLDKYLEEKENMSVSEIFKLKGEIYFRKLESLYLKEIIKNDKSLVLSLGGGTPCYANNHLILQDKDVYSFYLKNKISTLKNRLENEKDKRPLLKNISSENLATFIGQHLFERHYYYNFSKYSIISDNLLPYELCKNIIKIIKQ